MKEEKELARQRKEESKKEAREEKARLKAEKKERKERERIEREEALRLERALQEPQEEETVDEDLLETEALSAVEEAAAVDSEAERDEFPEIEETGTYESEIAEPYPEKEKELARQRKEESKKEAREEKARLKAEKKERKEREKRDREASPGELEKPEIEGREDLEAGVLLEPGREEADAEEERERWLSRLRNSLSKSRLNFVAPLSKALANRRFDDDFWEEVENILVSADVGMDMTLNLVERTRERMARDKVKDPEALLDLFREELAEAMDMGQSKLRFAEDGTSVMMVVGVNGTGKTTTIAKIGYLLRREEKGVILAAGDTFRAAGIEQLEAWGERVGLHTVKHKQGADAAAVVHDAVESARARGVDVVIADTAGRLHTKANLMEELKKIKRVAERGAEVTETLLVIDATTGQNGLIQAREFKDAVEVTGVILTKLDGTAKGGIVVAIVHELGIPIKFIGVGEGLDDLHPFDPQEFASALFS
ncbi:MAG: signal recognition particle-docking protein FtsY [Actinomycetota bacterium]|nr:signal recognition particle-docking protein FtsY [Actinomycetota bacterium]